MSIDVTLKIKRTGMVAKLRGLALGLDICSSFICEQGSIVTPVAWIFIQVC
jgi:hypothetical protein